MVLTLGVKAQDVAGVIIFPSQDTTVVIGADDSVRVNLQVAFGNVGTADLVAGNIVYYNMAINGSYGASNQSVTLPTGMTIPVGQMVGFQPQVLTMKLPAAVYTICFKTAGTSLGVDPNTSNDESCINLTVNAPASISENSANQFVAFPNPAKDMITINTAVKANVIRMFDMYGRLVYEISNPQNTNTINTESFANGAYFITLESVNGKSTQRVMISK